MLPQNHLVYQKEERLMFSKKSKENAIHLEGVKAHLRGENRHNEDRQSQSGQTLIELIVVIAVSVIVVGALVFAIIASLRNAQFSKNQSQATKLAQEGIEKVRSIRDRDGDIYTTITYPQSSPTRNISKFSELYTVNISHNICNTVNGDGPCYFYFTDTGVLNQGAVTNTEAIENFNRQLLLSDVNTGTPPSYQVIKTVTVVVNWTDFSGPHESRLTTILRKL